MFISHILSLLIIIHWHKPLKLLVCPESRQGCRAPLAPEQSRLRHTVPAKTTTRTNQFHTHVFYMMTRNSQVYLIRLLILLPVNDFILHSVYLFIFNSKKYCKTGRMLMFYVTPLDPRRWCHVPPQQETPEGQRSSLRSARKAVGACGRAKWAGEGAPVVSRSGPDTLPDSVSHRSATRKKTDQKINK